MMHRPVVTEIPRRLEPSLGDLFIDVLTPAQKHAAKRCETVRPPVVVAPDVWIALDDGPML